MIWAYVFLRRKHTSLCPSYWTLISSCVLPLAVSSECHEAASLDAAPPDSLYNEAPRQGGGVRWGIELEHCEQVNRLGLGELIEKYVKPCVAEAYSEKSSKKLIKAVKEPQEMAKVPKSHYRLDISARGCAALDPPTILGF